MIALSVAFAIALLVTWAVTPMVQRLAVARGAMAVPRSRDVHTNPIPRWGGIAIVAGVVAAVVITVTVRPMWKADAHGWNTQLVGVLLAGIFIAAVGILDDLKDLRAVWQAAGIVGAALILIAFNVRIEGLTNPLVAMRHSGYTPASWIPLTMPVSIVLTVFWVFVVTKTLDAIDGLDGLAAGVSAISAGTLALMAAYANQPNIVVLAAAVVGACIGFLRHNFNPAKIFMSTVGAQFLGLMLAAISILGAFKIAAAISVALPLLALGVPIMDYAVVLLKRLRSGAPLTAADQRHLHHRLLARGMSQKQAVWVIYGVTAVCCTLAVIVFMISGR